MLVCAGPQEGFFFWLQWVLQQVGPEGRQPGLPPCSPLHCP